MAQELKDYDIMDVEAMDDARLEESPTGRIFVSRVYLKSEADKVLAELKERLDTTEKLLNKALNGISNGNKHMMSLARKKNHADYKRCLAMAEWCDAEADVADADGDYEDMRWFQKWHKRWLKLAEKFKEAK